MASIARDFRLVEVGTADGASPQERLAFTMAAESLGMRAATRLAG
ncbi:hypothetical protein [Quisquiliibacterium transsilvanicum]|uniref:Uncharacterized protein n=1 Tax=Quisquiliibacterium transsilvanicum TaxID=1549638 RepID=A0A7W8MA43_9BURK|nr:hypothetical protein [Quisquiliibacterium transsilvanicum]MBB5272774.1 hypothetical protein [Quisquiliibacterium transsilvanicum]